MRLLLDTHAFLWFLLDDAQLSATARLAIEDPLNNIEVSPATYWEIAIKIRLGKYALMAILRRVVDSDRSVMSADAARAILRLRFGASDRRRINRLAAKNRQGKLNAGEEVELSNYIRVGQTLGILQSKARRSLTEIRESQSGDE